MAVTVLTDSNFTISAAGMYEYNGKQFEITAKIGGKYSGNVDGKVFRNWDKNGVKKLVGAEYKEYRKVTIPCGHADYSTCHGEHKTVAVSANRIEKQHRSVMRALAVLNDFLGYQDSLSMQVNAAWYEFKTEQDRLAAEAEQLRLKREVERKEAEAKKQAEEEAKKQKKLAEQILSEYSTLCKFMPEVQAASVIANTYGSDVVNSVLGKKGVE